MSTEPNDFRSWLLTHVDDRSPIGHLARDVRDDDEWPMPDGEPESFQLYLEHLEDNDACDDALEALEDAWGLFQDRWSRQMRQRQVRDLEHIRNYYGFEDRLGVRLYLDDRVRHCGREGTIIDTAGQYLIVLLDGEQGRTRCHPTANMEYATSVGWVKATPKPDPFADISHRTAQ